MAKLMVGLCSLLLSLLVTMILNPLLLDFNAPVDYQGLVLQFGSIFVLNFLLMDMLLRKRLSKPDKGNVF